LISNKRKILLISHSSNLTGGGEDDFERLLIYFHDKYHIIGVIPEGPRSNNSKKYCSEYIIIPSIIFPFSNFNLKRYIKYFLVSIKKSWILYPFLKNIRQNVEICFVNSSVCLNEILLLYILNIPFVLSIKEQIEPLFVRKIIYAFYRKAAKKVITISQLLKNSFDSKDRKNESIIIFSTINEKYYTRIKNEYKKNISQTTCLTLLNIGHIYSLKNQELLIKAVSELNSQFEIKVNFIGKILDEKYNNKLLRLIQNVSLNNIEFNFLGELDKESTIKEIIKTDFVVITSKQEGMSIVLAEALFLEKTVIATDVGVVSQVITDGVNGYIIKSLSSEELKGKLLILIKNPLIKEQFVNNSLATYNKFFNFEHYLKEHERILFSDK